MAKKDKTRLDAQDYYIDNIEATLKEVAEIFGITEKTAGLWSKKYDWEGQRLEYLSSPVRLKQILQRELVNVANGEKATISADGVLKLQMVIDKLDSKSSPVVVARTLKDLDNFISKQDAVFAKNCTKWHKAFLRYRVEQEA